MRWIGIVVLVLVGGFVEASILGSQHEDKMREAVREARDEGYGRGLLCAAARINSAGDAMLINLEREVRGMRARHNPDQLAGRFEGFAILFGWPTDDPEGLADYLGDDYPRLRTEVGNAIGDLVVFEQKQASAVSTFAGHRHVYDALRNAIARNVQITQLCFSHGIDPDVEYPEILSGIEF